MPSTRHTGRSPTMSLRNPRWLRVGQGRVLDSSHCPLRHTAHHLLPDWRRQVEEEQEEGQGGGVMKLSSTPHLKSVSNSSFNVCVWLRWVRCESALGYCDSIFSAGSSERPH